LRPDVETKDYTDIVVKVATSASWSERVRAELAAIIMEWLAER
jgi:hypothetical protein